MHDVPDDLVAALAFSCSGIFFLLFHVFRKRSYLLLCPLVIFSCSTFVMANYIYGWFW